MKKSNPLLKSSTVENVEEFYIDKNIQNFVKKNRNYVDQTQKFFCESQNLTARLKTEEVEDDKSSSINENASNFFKSPRGALGNLKKKFMELNHAINLENKNISQFPMQYYNYMPHNVKIIDLRNNKLKKFPEEIINFKNLESVKLDNNSIQSIPNNIFEQISPKYFSISNNYVKCIPPEIFYWDKNLEYLNISINFISNIPKEIGELSNLKSLHINNNSFLSLPREICKLTNLKELGLDWFKYIINGVALIINSTINFKIFAFFMSYLRSKKSEEILTLKEFFGNFAKKLSPMHALITPTNTKMVFNSTKNEDLGILRYLIIENPENVNILNSEGYSPLGFAINEEKYLSAKLLIQSGCNVNIGGGEYGSALNLGISKLQVYLIKDLFKYGADGNISNKNGDYSLNFIFKEWENDANISEQIFHLVMQNQTVANKRNEEGYCPLHIIISQKNKGALKAVIEYSENVDEQENRIFFDFSKKTTKNKQTCMHLAAQTDDFDIINVVLAQNNAYEQLFERDIDGNRPIHLAKRNYTSLKFIRKFEKSYISSIFPRNKQKITTNNSSHGDEDIDLEDEDEIKFNLNSKMKQINALNPKNNNFKSILQSSFNFKNGFNNHFNSPHNNDNIHASMKNFKIKLNFEDNNDSSIDSFKTDLDEENNCVNYNKTQASYRKLEMKKMPISPNNIRKIERIQKYSNYFAIANNEKVKFGFSSSRKLDLDNKNSLFNVHEKPPNKKPNQKPFFLSNVYKIILHKFEKYKKKIEEFHEEIISSQNLLSVRLYFLFLLFEIQHKILKIAMDLISKQISLAIVNTNLFESSQINEDVIKGNTKNSNLHAFQIVFDELLKIVEKINENNENSNYDSFILKYEIFTFCSFFNFSFFKEYFKTETREMIRYELYLGLVQFKQLSKLYN